MGAAVASVIFENWEYFWEAVQMNRIMLLVMGLSFSVGTATAGPIPDPYSPELQDLAIVQSAPG